MELTNNVKISMKEIGLKVRRARERKGFTRAKLAELINYSDQYISDIEKGKANIQLELFLKLSFVLEEDLLYFLSLDSLSQYSNNPLFKKYSYLNDTYKSLINGIIELIYQAQKKDLDEIKTDKNI